MLHAVQLEEDQALLSTEVLFDHEIKQIDDDFDKSRTRLRERVLEGLEERRRRAREEKEGEGIVSVGKSPRTIAPLRCQHSLLAFWRSRNLIHFFFHEQNLR
jgi:hypothetical protein